MLEGVGMPATPSAVAGLYAEFLDVFVLDARDEAETASVCAETAPGRSVAVECADTIMSDPQGRRRLARDVLEIARRRGAAVPAFLA